MREKNKKDDSEKKDDPGKLPSFKEILATPANYDPTRVIVEDLVKRLQEHIENKDTKQMSTPMYQNYVKSLVMTVLSNTDDPELIDLALEAYCKDCKTLSAKASKSLKIMIECMPEEIVIKAFTKLAPLIEPSIATKEMLARKFNERFKKKYRMPKKEKEKEEESKPEDEKLFL